MGATNCPETPRQRMIAMMYLFLTAMLALNVSTDILRGFTLVNQSLQKSLDTSSKKNERVIDDFHFLFEQNKDKVGEWFGKATEIRSESDSLVNFIEDLKVQIVRMADGRKFRGVEPDSILNQANLDVAGTIMVPNHIGGKKNGAILREKLERFRELVTFDGYTPEQRQSIARLFDTSKKGAEEWESRMFQKMPVAGAVTILTQLQNSIRSTEGDALEYLKSQVDALDFRVNSIEAFVIPESKYVIRGGQYQAQIVLAAIDTTARPIVRVGGQVIPDGRLVRGAGAVGNQSFSGEVELVRRDGTSQFFPFRSDYIVGEPSVTISADMMNVFYAGIDNPVSISVPGVPMSQISASMTNGTLPRTGNGWNAIPASINQQSVVSVTANIGGRTINFGSKPFRVKPLPPPLAFIAWTNDAGVPQRYRGGTRFPKAQLLASSGVRAALDDVDLDHIPFTVLGFEMHFTDALGQTIIEMSDGNRFTDRQMSQMRGLPSGRQFFITKTRARGPDGIVNTLPPIQVIVQ